MPYAKDKMDQTNEAIEKVDINILLVKGTIVHNKFFCYDL